ncbi:hypothetical protein [Falsigemmobacter faecalis]|uniref:Uncharacterized protein n=1 Tax=Falsigemmobacter faecalis TaxID=2488730 RepID=A0A3P3DJE5_9RHOB|nr:hypothetical protein [Falsigemmobacter faecalis]RRH74285.1 hypothetical protein EG244_11065 [Falsigemmobacter faecalis]
MFILVLLLFLPAWSAGAQAVTALSGDHPGFTRIVLDLPPQNRWELGRTGEGYGLRITPAPEAVDLSRVYSRIGRNRLASINWLADVGELQLRLGCLCHARLTEDRPGLLIVDIRIGPPPADSPFEQILTPLLPPLRLPKETPRAGPPQKVPFRPVTQHAEALSKSLMEDLSRGIAAGALRPVGRIPGPAPEVLPFDPPTPDQTTTPQPGQITFHNRPPAGAGDPPATEVLCITEDRLHISSWWPGSDPAAALAESRSHLTAERDVTDSEGLAAAVRLHLALGLGAEARAILALADTADPASQALTERSLWLSLSHIVDSEPDGGSFKDMAACDGPAALWAVLSDPEGALPPDLNEAALLRAFSALPAPLRQTLGPGLATRFLSSGRHDAAHSLHNAAARAAGPQSGAIALSDGRLNTALTSPGRAEAVFKNVIRTDAGSAAAALAELAELELKKGRTPDADLVAALEAMARDHSTGPDSRPLAAALAKARLLSGAHLQAFADISPASNPLRADLWRLLAERGSDSALAETALRADSASTATLPPGIQLKIGTRLAELGFASAAQHWLEPVASEGREQALALADLARRDGRAALRRLAGQEGTEAAKLRATALELLADAAAAARAWTEAGEPDRAARAAFIAGDRGATAPWLPRPLRDVLQELSTASPPEETEGPLATARVSLEASSGSRQAISELLAARTKQP